jgi:lactobin A/cerein 7B family class IIb bacteriocin
MSYMDHNDAFAPAGGIKELSFGEVEWVNGGIVPIVAAYYAIGIVGTLYVGAYAGLASMRLGYAANHK